MTRRGIFRQVKVWKTKEYFVYFLFFKPQNWRKRPGEARRHNWCGDALKIIPRGGLRTSPRYGTIIKITARRERRWLQLKYFRAFSYACGMISAKLSHGERVLLENVFFSLFTGERLAVIGETGSGKTMLALSILGLLPSNVRMQGGCLQLDGAALPAGRQLQALRGDKLVYIPQNGAEFLLPARTVRKQLYDSLKKLGLAAQGLPGIGGRKAASCGLRRAGDGSGQVSLSALRRHGAARNHRIGGVLPGSASDCRRANERIG